ncbi:MAG: SusC/RagA family TonB-linked outer membrane protein [Gemmatimonadales bacterium]
MRGLRYSIGLLLAAVWITPLLAQQPGGSIRGHVTDAASNQPLQGAVVRVGGRGTQTRADGGYLLAGVPAGTDSLRVTMIGYAPDTRSVTVAEGEILDVDVALTAQAAQLAELVVIGYGEQRAGNVTGAVTNVTSQEFNKGRVITPTELIQNKVAGVQVVENNEPGGRTSIRVRGPSSTTASNEPLYVVDGQPLGSDATTGRDPLNFLNPDDIASITVLRDAGAAAIYGTNAANGVVLITTKRGQQGEGGKPKFEYTGSVSASNVTRLPSMLNAQQFRAAVEQYAPGSAAQLQSANTDWFGAIDRTGFGQEHNLAVSGAGSSMDYRFSANFLDQKGIIDRNSVRRIGLGMNYTQRLAQDRLNLQFNLRGSHSDDQFTPGGVLGNAAQYGPTQPILDPASETGFYDWPGSTLTSADNPVAILNLAEEKGWTNRAVGNVQAGYSLPWIEGLRANLNLGFDAMRAKRANFSPSVLHREVVTGNGGRQSFFRPKQVSTVMEAYLNYTTPRPLGPGTLDLTGGYSWSRSHADSVYYEGNGLATDSLGNNGTAPAASVKDIVFEQQSKLISFFGRLNYNINDRYIVAASLRYDGSSRFGSANDFGTFPSVSAAWRLSQEPFLRGIKGLSDLKLRASWAKTGNQSFGNYLAYSSYQLGDNLSTYQFGDSVFTTSRPSAVDPNIKWEQTRAFNVGLDFGFANQRITGAIDWYDKLTSDLLFNVPVAGFSNLSNFVTTNIGSMRNRGIEMSLGLRLLEGGERGLTWQADFTGARNSNNLRSITPFGGSSLKILVGDVSGGVGTRIQVLAPGVPINSFYVFEHIREGGKPIYRDVNGDRVDGVPNGTINDQDLYVDQNGDGIINQGDLRPFHDPAPKWILGHSSYLAKGKFDFGFTFRAYLGNYMYNNVASSNGDYRELTQGSPYNLHTSVLETGFAIQQLQSDFYVEDASFLRLDNLTLGYTFNLRGQSARVFGTVQNVFTVTGYSGVDPSGNIAPSPTTSSLNGIDNNIYPRSRTFSGGLSLRL